MVDAALLGTGGGMPMPERFLASCLINYKGRKILIDCGEGTQVSMRILGWGFKSLDVICLTHWHGDHTVGIPGLLTTLGNSGRINPVTIIGPKGVKDIISGLRIIAPYLPYELNIIESPKVCSFKLTTLGLVPMNNAQELVISTLELDHSVPCLGYNINIKRNPIFDIKKAFENNVPKHLWNTLQGGNAAFFEDSEYKPSMVLGEDRKGIKISYITDTRPIKAIPEFINNSDLFICEGTFKDNESIEKAILSKHMTFNEAAELALLGNVKEMVLTHFSPSIQKPEEYVEEARAVFENTTIGTDRMIKTLVFEK
ncbi:MAG: ribonuclease Z [Solirubrobacterales bacterium]